MDTCSANDLTGKLLRPEILALTAYHVTDASGLIKLDAMENPYPWPEGLTTEWLESLRHCPINRYPDPEAKAVTAIIRQLNKLPDNMPVLLGNGSDEIIQILLMALKPGSTVLAPEPTFVMYRQISQSLGLNYHAVPLQADNFALDLTKTLEAISRLQPGIIFLAYPNNPSGNLFADDSIHAIIKAAPGLVVLDEAYSPFAGASFINALPDYNNLLIMRTVSKLGLAGLRLGYLAGPRSIVEQLNKIRLPYNINSLTQISVEFALKHSAIFEQQASAICAERTRVSRHLASLPGITPYPSSANFILFKTPRGKAPEIFQAIKEQGVLIKNLASQNGLLADCLRVTIGTPDENSQFLNGLEKTLTY